MRIDVVRFSKDGKIWIYVSWFPSVRDKKLEFTSFDFQLLGMKDVNLRVSISKRWRRKTWVYIFRFPSAGDKGCESRFFVSQRWGQKTKESTSFDFQALGMKESSFFFFLNRWRWKNLRLLISKTRINSFVWQLLGTEKSFNFQALQNLPHKMLTFHRLLFNNSWRQNLHET